MIRLIREGTGLPPGPLFLDPDRNLVGALGELADAEVAGEFDRAARRLDGRCHTVAERPRSFAHTEFPSYRCRVPYLIVRWGSRLDRYYI